MQCQNKLFKSMYKRYSKFNLYQVSHLRDAKYNCLIFYNTSMRKISIYFCKYEFILEVRFRSTSCCKDPSTFNISTISPVQIEIYYIIFTARLFHGDVVRNPFAEDHQ